MTMVNTFFNTKKTESRIRHAKGPTSLIHHTYALFFRCSGFNVMEKIVTMKKNDFGELVSALRTNQIGRITKKLYSDPSV